MVEVRWNEEESADLIEGTRGLWWKFLTTIALDPQWRVSRLLHAW